MKKLPLTMGKLPTQMFCCLVLFICQEWFYWNTHTHIHKDRTYHQKQNIWCRNKIKYWHGTEECVKTFHTSYHDKFSTDLHVRLIITEFYKFVCNCYLLHQELYLCFLKACFMDLVVKKEGRISLMKVNLYISVTIICCPQKYSHTLKDDISKLH